MVPPMPGTPPILGAGAGVERAQGCCRKLLLRGFHCNWGETRRFHQLLLGSGGERGLGVLLAGLWQRGPSPCHTSVTMQRRPVGAVPGEKPWPEPGSAPGHCPVPPRAPWREGGQQVESRGQGAAPWSYHESMCWGGGGFGGEVEVPLLQSPRAVGGSEHKARAAPRGAAGPVGAPRWGLILGGAAPHVFRASWLSDLT